MEHTVKNEKRIKVIITVLSIAVPAIVAFLFQYRIPGAKPLYFLPPIYAAINGLTAVVLVAAVVAIKKGNRKLHQRLMTTCILFSVAFLAPIPAECRTVSIIVIPFSKHIFLM